jgi:N4-gp56 family major capsid protein
MTVTNFTQLTTEQKTVWSRDLWKMARNYSFINKFTGEGPNSVIQKITELTKTERGTRAVMTLVADLEGDGVAGDSRLKDREEKIKAFDKVIQIDQLRNANKSEGRMAEQKSIVKFRETSRDVLAYWLADRIDQLAFLTLGGISYAFKPNGATRPSAELGRLAFAADVVAPSSKRVYRWTGGSTNTLTEGGASSAVASGDVPKWKLFVDLKAAMKDQYIRGIKEEGGNEFYHVFMAPRAMAALKMDSDYMLNLRHAQERGDKNPLFSGSTVKLDGFYFHEFRHVPTTLGAGSGSKYGGSGTVDGSQIIVCGAQALGMVDLGTPEWTEEYDDYENQSAVAVAKMFGLLKPKFNSIYAGNTEQDFGAVSVYTSFA